MRRIARTLLCLTASAALVVGATGGCGLDATLDRLFGVEPPPDFSRPADMGRGFMFESIDFGLEGDIAAPPEPCEDGDFTCLRARYGPMDWPFSLSSDEPNDPRARDDGVERDLNGHLRMDIPYPYFSSVYITNTQDGADGGTVSRIDSRTVREVARYPSVTCHSLKTGGTAPCDGENGCCALDDPARYAARGAKMPEPGHQAVQRMANQPSRTAVDYDMSLLVANRAPGGQASVTKIAGSLNECVDRNQDLKLQTSGDTDGDGRIEVDCNGDGIPDDVAGVKQKPCSNGMSQEYYGVDDECVLWTINVFAPGARASALGLSWGESYSTDAWIGSPSGKFVRIDGGTARIKADTALPSDCTKASGPWGMAVDASGIAWVTEKGAGKLCGFDTKKAPFVSKVVRDPQWGAMVGDGITLDRDQNVWVGGGVARYTPDRSNGLKNLDAGWWTRLDGVAGMGIAADSRNANLYFVYSCLGATVLQIPASTLKVMKADQTVMSPGWPTITMPCTAVAPDQDQHIWGIDDRLGTRALVDKLGKITQPVVNGAPMGKNKCPAGDSCANLGAENYSDFTSFGFRTYGRPYGSYAVVVPGCTDQDGRPADTEWWSIAWDADVPPNTSLNVHAKSSDGLTSADMLWPLEQWTQDFPVSPAWLMGTLGRNYYPDSPPGVHDGSLLVEFTFKTQAQNATPKLKSFEVRYRCPVALP